MARIFTLCILIATLVSGAWASPTGDEALIAAADHGGLISLGEAANGESGADPDDVHAALDHSFPHLSLAAANLWRAVAVNAPVVVASETYHIRAPPFTPERC